MFQKRTFSSLVIQLGLFQEFSLPGSSRISVYLFSEQAVLPEMNISYKGINVGSQHYGEQVSPIIVQVPFLGIPEVPRSDAIIYLYEAAPFKAQ